VVLDLRGVRVADTAGLDALHRLGMEFAASGHELLIRHAPEGVADRG
jgi:ABC-type transporter Mla MlaB component